MVDSSKGLGVDEEHRISRSPLTKLRLLLARPIIRWTRSMTLGSRTAVIDGQGRFMLVKQTYTPGWIFPGGGVERGETCLQAAKREVEEEAAIFAKGALHLVGMFSNHEQMAGDHLAFYVLREFEQRAFKPNMEIADARFFSPDELPERLNGGTRRRIQELTQNLPPSEFW
jgi:8-oxo-dGTP pyrophosphatase MutT (NUDIX family)